MPSNNQVLKWARQSCTLGWCEVELSTPFNCRQLPQATLRTSDISSILYLLAQHLQVRLIRTENYVVWSIQDFQIVLLQFFIFTQDSLNVHLYQTQIYCWWSQMRVKKKIIFSPYFITPHCLWDCLYVCWVSMLDLQDGFIITPIATHLILCSW
jgi:hypothetical protein